MDETEEETTAQAPKEPVARVFRIQETARAQALRWKTSFCEGRQHDHKDTSWTGKSRQPGTNWLRERLVPLGYQATSEVPYEDRRPSTPIPMARQVTSRFTDMLMGDRRKPTLSVLGDVKTEAFLHAVMRKSDAWDTLASVRDACGACGSSALVPALDDGRPTTRRLRAEDLWVAEWAQTDRWVPKLVFWQRLVEDTVADPNTGKLLAKRVWRTKAWDEEFEYTYEDVPEDYGQAPKDFELRVRTEIPLSRKVEHGAGRCPVIWVQNTRDTESPEGEPDNEGVYELADTIDKLASMLARGAIANIDPTLHIADDERHARRYSTVRKGWGNVIRTSEKGKVNLVQITEGSFKVGWLTLEKFKQSYLQTVRCVLVDPETAGKYQSGEAQSMLWRAMEGACDRKRTPLTDAIRQLSEIWIALAERFGVGNETDPEAGGILLPPLMLKFCDAVRRGYAEEPDPVDYTALSEGMGLYGDDGSIERDGITPERQKAINEAIAEAEEEHKAMMAEILPYTHEIGEGRAVDVVWGPYHDPTPMQTREFATMLGLATTNKQILSAATGTALMVRHLGLGSPEEEIERIKTEKETNMATFGAGMFGEEEKADADAKEDMDEAGEDEDEDDKPAAKTKEPEDDVDDDGEETE